MSKYFEVVGLSVLCAFLLPDGSRFDLRTGIPKRALEVYKSGFKNLGLKPGAEVLFAKEKVAELVKLIGRARRIQDVDVLLQVKPKSPALQRAAEARIKELQTNNNLKP